MSIRAILVKNDLISASKITCLRIKWPAVLAHTLHLRVAARFEK